MKGRLFPAFKENKGGRAGVTVGENGENGKKARGGARQGSPHTRLLKKKKKTQGQGS